MTSRWSSRATRAALLVLLAGAALLFTAVPAGAHAVLEESNPVDGASLAQAPDELTLRFDEDVDVASTAVRLFDGAGHLLTTGPAHAAEPGAQDATTVVADLPRLATDRYLIRWQTITSDDFHPVTGSIAFGVGGADATPVGTSDARGLGLPLESALRLAVLAGFMLVAAGWVLLLVMSRSFDVRPAARRSVERSMVVGGGLSIAALVALMSALTLGVEAPPPGAFVAYWALAIGCTAVSAALAPGHGSSRGTARGAAAAVLGLATVLAAGWALTHLGHGGADPVVATAHTLATSVWAGGVALLAVLCLPALREGAVRWTRHLLARFALVAVPCVLLTAATGFLMAANLVPSSGGLAGTGYGRALIAKSAVAAVAIGLGGLTFLAVRSGRRDAHAARRLAAEVWAVLLVVGLAAALSAGQPPDDRRWLPDPTAAATSGLLTTSSDDLVVTFTMSPGTPGPNFLTIGVLDTRRPAPAPIATVSVALDDGTPLDAVRQNATEWLVSQEVPRSGAAVATVRVARPGYDDGVASFPWQVAPTAGTERGGAALAPLWRLGAMLVGLVALALLALTLGRRRRRAGRRPPVTTEAWTDQPVG